jgi:hypothetical protein
MAETEERTGNPWQSVVAKISPVLRQLIFVLLGVILYFVLFAVIHRQVRRSVLEPEVPEISSKGPPVFVWLFRGTEMLNKSAVFQISAFFLVLFIAFYRRNQQKSWIYALLVGFGLPSILFHWVLHWF